MGEREMILLDTDVMIELLDKQSGGGEEYLSRIMDSGDTYCTSSLNFHEIIYGISKYAEKLGPIRSMPVIAYTKEDGILSSKLELLAERIGKAVPRIDTENNCNDRTDQDKTR